MAVETKTGTISVETENIFPIIRKWLYTDQDIFLRELISNGTDAIRKLERLGTMGEVDLEDGYQGRINVVLDTDKNTLTVSDNGIGMSAEEIDKYINQIAFSGAMDFVNTYKDRGDTDGIIGHFGLGFYSVFMVADHVEIQSKSCTGAAAARWVSEDGTTFQIDAGEREQHGSDMILTLNDEAREQLNAGKLREIIHKYCQFMPYEIYFEDTVGEAKAREDRMNSFSERHGEWENKRKEAEDKGEAFTETEPTLYEPGPPQPVNNTQPLWLKAPRDCTDEEYKDFYREVFNDYREPLFWIHLNMDYPFKVKGILYFPQAEKQYETFKGRIKVYSSQVFVADDIREIIPEFLFLLKGTLDLPEIPLNVSRSTLQNDQYVSKLSDHIVRKVADKLNKMYEDDRESYDKYWPDLSVFIRYGCLTQEKFYDRVKDSLLYVTTDDELKTAADLGETIRYTNDAEQQVNYVTRAREAGHEVVVMAHELDVSFMNFIESKQSPLKFVQVDAEVEGGEGIEEHKDVMETLFRKVSADDQLQVEVKALGQDELPVMIVESEQSKRMQEMRRQYARMQGSEEGFDQMFPVDRTLMVNTDSPLISRLAALTEVPDQEKETEMLAAQAWDLARLSAGLLTGDALQDFLRRSTSILNGEIK